MLGPFHAHVLLWPLLLLYLIYPPPRKLKHSQDLDLRYRLCDKPICPGREVLVLVLEQCVPGTSDNEHAAANAAEFLCDLDAGHDGHLATVSKRSNN